MKKEEEKNHTLRSNHFWPYEMDISHVPRAADGRGPKPDEEARSADFLDAVPQDAVQCHRDLETARLHRNYWCTDPGSCRRACSLFQVTRRISRPQVCRLHAPRCYPGPANRRSGPGPRRSRLALRSGPRPALWAGAARRHAAAALRPVRCGLRQLAARARAHPPGRKRPRLCISDSGAVRSGSSGAADGGQAA